MGMTYTKAKDGDGLRYTEMCMYIDKIIKEWYENDRPISEEEGSKIYKYIYLLYYSLSCKKRYFNDENTYDSYALYCASKAYIRLVDPRQKNIVDGEPELQVVKSILNYAKATLYGWKCYWQDENYSTIISQKTHKQLDPVLLRGRLTDQVNSKYRDRISQSVIEDIANLPNILWDIINKLPKATDRDYCNKLYTSVLLTFIYSFDNYKQRKTIKYYDHATQLVLWYLQEEDKPLVKYVFDSLKYEMQKMINYSFTKFDLSEEQVLNSFWDVSGRSDENE